MNKEKGTILLKFLKNLPEERFNYQLLLNGKEENRGDLIDIIQNTNLFDMSSCQTVGCVGGWASILFKEDFLVFCEKTGMFAIFKFCCSFLELTEKEHRFLFWKFCGLSSLSDAILRLEYLLSDGHLDDYDWSKETRPELKIRIQQFLFKEDVPVNV